MNNIDNPLSEYKSPPEETLRNFGIDISRQAVEKYALKKFGRLPQSHIEMTSARGSKIIDETRRSMNNKNINTKNSARDSFDKGNYGILHIVTADELKNC
nr:MAG TPA: RNA polymerase sigma-54 factor [Caudoviricetes sp.]